MSGTTDPGLLSQFGQWVVAAVAAIPVIALGISKANRMWAADRTGRLSEDALGDVVKGLRVELARLQQHNSELVIEFEKAQMRIVKLAGENQRLQVELEELHATVASALRRHGKGS